MAGGRSAMALSVAINPGEIALTRIPESANSLAKAIVNPRTAIFETPYGEEAIFPAIDEILMTFPPPRLFMLSKAATEQFTTPIRLTSNSARTSARARVVKGKLYFVKCNPALFIKISIPPNSAMVFAMLIFFNLNNCSFFIRYITR